MSSGWTLQLGERSSLAPDSVRAQAIPATVPGCVHTDLLAAGMIADPLVAQQDLLVQWIGRCDWTYRCVFDAPDADTRDRVDLVCEGLDTVGSLSLNGRALGEVGNMHVGHRFDLRKHLQLGRNELVIAFAAPVPFVEEMAERFGDLPCEGFGSNPRLPHNMIRKYACNFGWDWGPALPTAGIWRSIYLEAWSEARVSGVRPSVVHAGEDSAHIIIDVDLERARDAADGSVRMTLTDPLGRRVAEETIAVGPGAATVWGELRIDRPRRWWPVGYGDQPLYRLTVSLTGASGFSLDRWEKHIGLRTLEWVTTPDDVAAALPGDATPRGSTCHLRVNGQSVFCKGANWIPDDCFPSRMTAARYLERVTQARDANMNMLRVWGGGIYEDERFYEACDRLGVLVWQDFCCACAAYPESEPFLSWFEAEARYNVTRLARHASLAMWCGNNECNQAVEQWGKGFERYRVDNPPAWGLGYYTGVFPRVMKELDPTRPYWPGSPYSATPGTPANAEHEGDTHIWDVWNGQGNAKNYLAHTPRFASEFGFHGPATWPTLDRAIPPDQRRFDSPAMVHHNRHLGGQTLANQRIGDYFTPPEAFDDWLYLAQVVQARSLALGVEWFRALSPHCGGALYWQLNDCWPVSSWSAIDGDGRPKPLWYATRRFLAPRLVTIRPAQPTPSGAPIGTLAVYLHNDSASAWDGTLDVELHHLNGSRPRIVLSQAVMVESRDCLKLVLPEGLVGSCDTFLVARIGGERSFWFFAPDHDMPYRPALTTSTLERDGHTYHLTVKARSLVRDLCMFAERLDPDARVSDQLLTLLPGEEATFIIESQQRLSLSALTQPPVMQSANRFGA